MPPPPPPSVEAAAAASAAAAEAEAAAAAAAEATTAEAAAEAASTAASAAAAAAAAAVEDGESRVRRTRLQVKQRGEAMLRASGLTYFIVRATELDDRDSSRRLVFSQGSTVPRGTVPREDIAEVAVESLLDPRACNVVCTVAESQSAAPSEYEQDISRALEVLQPNRF